MESEDDTVTQLGHNGHRGGGRDDSALTGPRITVPWNTSRPDSSDTVGPIPARGASANRTHKPAERRTQLLLWNRLSHGDGRKPEHATEETTRYQTLEGALACLIEDFDLSGIRANPDQPSLFNGHQS